MTKLIGYFFTVFGICMMILALQVRRPEFNPYQIGLDYFEDEEISDGKVFRDRFGSIFKVECNELDRGVYMKQHGQWQRHGVWFTADGSGVFRKFYYNSGEEEEMRAIVGNVAMSPMVRRYADGN